MDFVGIVSGRNLQWNRHIREQIFNKSGINYVAGPSVLKFTVLAAQVAWRTLSKSIINSEKRTPQTCRGGFVSLCELAGRTPSYSIYARHAEAIVDVAVEFEDGRAMVPRYSEQLLPVSWLPLAFLVLDNKLCWQAERQSERSLTDGSCQRIAYLTTSCAENSSNPALGLYIPQGD